MFRAFCGSGRMANDGSQPNIVWVLSSEFWLIDPQTDQIMRVRERVGGSSVHLACGGGCWSGCFGGSFAIPPARSSACMSVLGRHLPPRAVWTHSRSSAAHACVSVSLAASSCRILGATACAWWRASNLWVSWPSAWGGGVRAMPPRLHQSRLRLGFYVS